uniref:Uncharacterized protein n=1 Tax=Anguilla anguilla TaxID=7936 RepID=A0A0E9R0X9_ANGAN
MCHIFKYIWSKNGIEEGNTK